MDAIDKVILNKAGGNTLHSTGIILTHFFFRHHTGLTIEAASFPSHRKDRADSVPPTEVALSYEMLGQAPKPKAKKLSLCFMRLVILLSFLLLNCEAPAQKSKTYLALGDSYTIGESVAEAGRWPVQLVEALRNKGYLLGAPRIIARTGWTTDELSRALDNSNLDVPYDYVSLLIGVNNQYRGRPAEEFRAEFSLLLERAISYAGGNTNRVFVLSIPDWGVTPFASGRNPLKIAMEIDAYNAIKKEICEARGIAFFNITDISRQAPAKPSLLAEDTLHPSAEMYALWVEEILAFFP